MEKSIQTEKTTSKQRLRAEIRRRLAANPDRVVLSGRIWRNASQLDIFKEDVNDDRPIMAYAEMPEEVVLFPYLLQYLLHGFPVAFPCSEGDELHAVLIRDASELVRTEPFGIREPRPEIRRLDDRRIDPSMLQLVIVPGLAFDRQGGRLGRGKGFYDRFLARTPSSIQRVALAFECQLVDAVPMDVHDRRMDVIVTETAVYPVDPSSRSETGVEYFFVKNSEQRER